MTMYGGSSYQTIEAAARAWACDALPDVSVIGGVEDPAGAAAELEAHWWGEAQRIGEGAPDGEEPETWRRLCRAALVARIEGARS